MSSPPAERAAVPRRAPFSRPITKPHLLDPSQQRPAVRSVRMESIDCARGWAIALMILSHGVKGLLDFGQIPSWGLVPVHLVTKISSTLFILVFGVSLAIAYVPWSDQPEWRTKRAKLWTRALVVFFWYKALTIVEMFHLYSRDDILKTLTYRAFPVYVEILGFYALALIWVPLILPLWKKSGTVVKMLSPILLAAVAELVRRHFDFWGMESVQALMVEHERHYTWGQLARGPLILLGLVLGEVILWGAQSGKRHLIAGLALLGAALALFGTFFWSASNDPEGLSAALIAVARNEGKHPPGFQFMVLSLGGALAVIGGMVLGGNRLAKVFLPFTILGKNALQAFVFHILVIFVFYRYLFNYWRGVSYEHALTLTAFLMVLTVFWVKVLRWVQSKPS